MKKLVISVLLALGAVLALLVPPVSGSAPTAVASASDCDVNGLICGRLKNTDATGDSIWVTLAWGVNGSGRTLYAGWQSWDHWADVDGFYVGHCWRVHLWLINNGDLLDYGYRYEGWHKITNNSWPPSSNYWKVDGIVAVC